MSNLKVLRWVGAIIMTIAVTLHTLNVYPANVYVQIIGAFLWMYLGYKEKDWPLVANFVPQIFIMIVGLILISYNLL
jgi:hypothetical protein